MTFSYVYDLDLPECLFSFQMINELLANNSDNSNSLPESIDDGHTAGAVVRQSVTADDGGTVEQAHSVSQVSPCEFVLDDSAQPCSDDTAPPLCDPSPHSTCLQCITLFKHWTPLQLHSVTLLPFTMTR